MVMNATEEDVVGYTVTLDGMKAPMRSLTDCVPALLLPSYEIDTILWPLAFTSSSVTVSLPLVEAGKTKFVDVYWIYNPPEKWKE